MKILAYPEPPRLAIAEGATTPNLGSTGAGTVVWSTTVSALVVWTGSAWHRLETSMPAAVVLTCSANQGYTNGTEYVAPGLSTSITSPGTFAEWDVSMALDVEGTTANTALFLSKLHVGGSAFNGQLCPIKIQNGRQPVVGQWTVTGLSAGSHTFEIVSFLTGSGGYDVIQTHSTVRIRRTR